MSVRTARICSPTTCAGTSATPVTPLVFCTVTDVIALVPHTPSAANVLRSAWMPAPPPESEPAIVRTRGMEAPRLCLGTKVVPALRLQRSLRTVGLNGDEPLAFPDFPDLRERRAEPPMHLRRSGRGCAGRERGQELVVLATRERELEGVKAERIAQTAERPRHRDVVEADGRRHPTLPTQTPEVLRQTVGHVNHRRR